MAVSPERTETREPVVTRVLTPVMVERPKSAMRARRSWLIRMLACTNEHQRYTITNLKITTHPFQVSVDHLEAVHILQAFRDINELKMSAKD